MAFVASIIREKPTHLVWYSTKVVGGGLVLGLWIGAVFRLCCAAHVDAPLLFIAG